MKPIFEEERQFFYKKTGILLPTDCWRDGSKIYLDCTCNKPLYQFKVVNKNIIIKKNNSSLFVDYQQKKIDELINQYTDRLDNLFKMSFYRLSKFILQNMNKQYVFSHSGGKDSVVAYTVWEKVLSKILKKKNININYVVNFANTSNDTADTYKFIKTHTPTDKLKILNPKEGFYQWIKRKNYYTPSCLVRNCCSTYKEGQITKAYDNDVEYVMCIGVRSSESAKRSKYQFMMDDAFYKTIFNGKSNMPKKWINIAPIIDWNDEDVWLFILKYKLDFNRQYRLGFNRCGCLICPYQSDYIDLLIEEHYPKQWKRWVDILTKSYTSTFVYENFKWSLEEWINGKWKLGSGKEHELIHKKATPARIKELAKIKGVTEDIAVKYFNKQCSCCSKKLNADEIAMNLKIIGRNIDLTKLLCKKCFCNEFNITGKEYRHKVIEFRNQGCNLF